MNRGETKALTALAISMFTVATGIGFITPLLATYADTLGAGGIWIGLIFSADPAVRAVTMTIVGYLSDIKGRKSLLLIGLFGHTIVAALMGVCLFPWQLFMLRVLQGMFSAMVMPVSRAYAGTLAPQDREGSTMGMFNLAFMLGFAMGPLMGGVTSDLLGLRMPFMIMAGLSLVALVIIWGFVPEESKTHTTVAPRITDALKSPLVRGIVLARAFNSMALGVIISLFPLYVIVHLGLSGSALGIIMFTLTLLASSLQPLFGAIADRVNRIRMVAIGFILTPLALILVPQAQSFAALMLLSIFIGLGPGVFIPASLAIAVVEGKKYGMGSTMGLIEMALALGMAIGSIIGGSTVEFFGMEAAFYVVACTSSLGLPVLLLSIRGRKYRAGTCASLPKSG